MVSQSQLKSLFYYDDGKLYWKNPPDKVSYLKNKEAGADTDREYKTVGISGKRYRLHRIIYIYHHGNIPENAQIDHIDNNRSNNKIENLRIATASQNKWNSKKQKNNKSGIKGIHWCASRNKWVAQCKVKGKLYSLGRYSNLDDAKTVLEEFRKNHHGEFINNG